MPNKQREYSFSGRFKWMQEARQLLDAAWYPRLSHDGRWVVLGDSRGSIKINRDDHIDTIVQLTNSDHLDTIIQVRDGLNTLTIDEKLDRKLRDTIFCETVSVKEANKPGWMVPGVSRADVLLWAFRRKKPYGLMVYMLWLDPLIDWFWEHKDWFKEFPIHNKEKNKRWTTIGRSVPLRFIPKEIFMVDGELVTAQMSMF